MQRLVEELKRTRKTSEAKSVLEEMAERGSGLEPRQLDEVLPFALHPDEEVRSVARKVVENSEQGFEPSHMKRIISAVATEGANLEHELSMLELIDFFREKLCPVDIERLIDFMWLGLSSSSRNAGKRVLADLHPVLGKIREILEKTGHRMSKRNIDYLVQKVKHGTVPLAGFYSILEKNSHRLSGENLSDLIDTLYDTSSFDDPDRVLSILSNLDFEDSRHLDGVQNLLGKRLGQPMAMNHMGVCLRVLPFRPKAGQGDEIVFYPQPGARNEAPYVVPLKTILSQRLRKEGFGEEDIDRVLKKFPKAVVACCCIEDDFVDVPMMRGKKLLMGRKKRSMGEIAQDVRDGKTDLEEIIRDSQKKVHWTQVAEKIAENMGPSEVAKAIRVPDGEGTHQDVIEEFIRRQLGVARFLARLQHFFG